jgi:hypothetical protein
VLRSWVLESEDHMHVQVVLRRVNEREGLNNTRCGGAGERRNLLLLQTESWG